MKPHEFADFLAGCFAPLAFFWLVLGFFQQGDELRNSVTALKLQGEELHNSVEQQRQLVEVTREQLGIDRSTRDAAVAETIRKATPIFHITGGFAQWSSPIITSRFEIRNVGAECRNVVFSDQADNELRLPVFGKEERLRFEYEAKTDEKMFPNVLTIECVNGLGQSMKFQTSLNPVQGQYGPEYKVASKEGLFAQIIELGVASERNTAPPITTP